MFLFSHFPSHSCFGLSHYNANYCSNKCCEYQLVQKLYRTFFFKSSYIHPLLKQPTHPSTFLPLKNLNLSLVSLSELLKLLTKKAVIIFLFQSFTTEVSLATMRINYEIFLKFTHYNKYACMNEKKNLVDMNKAHFVNLLLLFLLLL